MKSKKSAGNTRALRILLGTLVFLAVTFGLLVSYAYRSPEVADELSLDRVYELAANGQVRTAVLLDEASVVVGQRCLEEGSATGSFGAQGMEFPADRQPCPPPVAPFQATYPASDVATQQLIDRLAVAGAEVHVDPQPLMAVARVLATFIFPVLFLVNVFGFVFLMRGGESSMADIAGFGRMGKKGAAKGADKKDKKRKRKKDANGDAGEAASTKKPGQVTFADVAGADEVVAELREVTDYLKDPAKYESYGAAAPKGALLFGPPGCGKTLTARAVAGEADVPFFSVSGAEFIESLVGVGAARVRDLFAQVREVAPAIVFIDEIDAVGRKRSGEGVSGGEREQTVNQLLVEMDGFEVSSGIVLMGATNRPDILDPALMRPGRFDRHVTLEAPDINGRIEILQLHAKNKPLAPDVDFGVLAKRMPGFTGADLANLVNEAALLAIRQGEGTQISMAHFSEAIERVLHGPQRRGKLMSAEERRRLAYHESGHALMAAAVGQAKSVQRVSILARGRGLGSSMISPEASDRVLLAASEMLSSVAIAMGGIAAERLVFAELSTTTEDDLDKANATARQIVGVYGMSTEVGPLRLLRTDEGYLGSDARVVEAISGQTLGLFDAAVRARMEEAQAAAEEFLAANRGHLDVMAHALEQHETLEGEELDRMLAGVPVEGPARLMAAASSANGQTAAKPAAKRTAGRSGAGQSARSTQRTPRS